MHKHIVIVSEESVFGGYYRCGVGEVVDTLADALRKHFEVTVVTPGRSAHGSRGGRISLGLYGEAFYEAAAARVTELQPDLLCSFGRPDFRERLQVSCPKVLAFDRWEDIANQSEHVGKYDAVVTLSAAYAEEVTAARPETAQWPLQGIICGISPWLYSQPDKSKAESRQKYYASLGEADLGKFLVVTTGRLAEVKGTAQLIQEAEEIASLGIQLVVYGAGDAEYTAQLTALHEAGVLHFVPHLADYIEMCAAMEAADFYLAPSLHEVCGLQPMKAARMGAVPIVRPVGGMGENFDQDNAVLITGTLAQAVAEAIALSPEEYARRRNNALQGPWSWETRVQPWVELFSKLMEGSDHE